jgi:hypothetical protein
MSRRLGFTRQQEQDVRELMEVYAPISTDVAVAFAAMALHRGLPDPADNTPAVVSEFGATLSEATANVGAVLQQRRWADARTLLVRYVALQIAVVDWLDRQQEPQP